MWKNSVISIEEFVQRLIAGGGIIPSPAIGVEYGYLAGWLEAQDVAEKEEPLQRKSAARILHEFLRRELKENDEIDGSPAYRLQDLFDCRVCAGHIIQVYVKGIMDGLETEKGFMFGAENCVSAEEAEDIACRMFCKRQRKPRVADLEQTERIKNLQCISEEQAVEFLRKHKAVLVDVRTGREFEEHHMQNAISIPLLSIIKNPYQVCENRSMKILLYCTEGHQSKAAAQCLLEAGYEDVAYFAWATSW